MQNTQENIKLFGNLITASGIFCLAMALLLLINYWHIRQNKPLETEALKSLIQQFQTDPESETLKKEIRSLDLLARKAFFTANWQINTGAILLLIGGIVFAAFLRIYHTMKAKILEPLITGVDSNMTRMLSQRWILIIGGLLMGTALVASYLTTDYLKFYEETGTVVQAPVVAASVSSVESGVRVAVVDTGKVKNEKNVENEKNGENEKSGENEKNVKNGENEKSGESVKGVSHPVHYRFLLVSRGIFDF